MEKNKKRTLTISSNLKKKIDTTSIKNDSKRSFSVEKKKNFRSNKSTAKKNFSPEANTNQDFKKRSITRKFMSSKLLKILLKRIINSLRARVSLNLRDLLIKGISS